jgi:hypothetical protein
LQPFLPLRGQHLAPFVGDLVIAPAALTCLFDPASLNPLALFELVQRGVEGGEVEGERAARSLFDQLSQLVAVARLVVEKRQHHQLGSAFFGFADRAGELHMTENYMMESVISQLENG